MDELTMEPPMALALCASFGSVARWRASFSAMAQQAKANGPRWALLSFEPHAGRLLIGCAASPDDAPNEAMTILALDLQAQPADGDDLIARVDWAAVYQRYQAAVHAASEPFGATQDDVAAALVFDVRRAGVFAQAPSMIPRAHWSDPAAVDQWAGELPKGRDIVVYCVYGHEVGRATAMRLRAAGLQARYLQGGIDGWLAAGLPVVPRTHPADPGAAS